MCAGLDSNQRRPKPTRLQRVPFDRLGTDATDTVCLTFTHATIFHMRAVRFALAFLTPAAIALLPFIASAQLPDRLVPCDGLDCTVCSLAALAQNLLNAGIFMAVFISALLFAYAGWLYLTDAAISGQQKAKGMFLNVVVGLVLILGAWLVVDTLMKVMLGGSYMPWNSICG